MTLIHGSLNDKFLDGVLLKWHTFSPKEKLDRFVNNACHELNLYLAHKDHQFFVDHVVKYIANKIEWTFVDVYLLARFASDGHCKGEMAYTLNSMAAFDDLNFLEKCLAIEYGIFQDEQSLRERAKRLAKNAIDVMELQTKSIFDNEKQGQYTKLIDGILEM